MSLLNAIVRASQKVQKAKPKKTTTVYHGSDADLTQDTIATQNKSGSDFGEGIYWASDIDEATNYGKNLYKADVSFKNPLILENRYQINGIFDELIGLKEQGKVSKDVYMKEYLQSLGYDGLIVKNPIMGENTSKPWFVSLDNTSFNNFEKLNQGLLGQVQKAKPKSDLGEGLLGQVNEKVKTQPQDITTFKNLKKGDTVVTYHATPSAEIEGGQFQIRDALHGGSDFPRGVHSAPQIKNTFLNLDSGEFGNNIFKLETQIKGDVLDLRNPDPKLIKRLSDDLEKNYDDPRGWSHLSYLLGKIENGRYLEDMGIGREFLLRNGIDTIRDGAERIISLNPENIKILDKVK